MNGFKSYLMFTGKTQFLGTVIASAGAVVFIIAARIIKIFLDFPDLWDFIHMMGEVMWSINAVLALRGVFNANVKSAPGYRFFHALPNASLNFGRALLTANICLLIGTAIFAGIDFLLFGDSYLMLFAGLALFALGWINLFGNIGKFWINVIPFFVIGFSGGFLNGITDDEELPDTVMLVAFAVCAVFCAVGILYTTINSKRLWEREK